MSTRVHTFDSGYETFPCEPKPCKYCMDGQSAFVAVPVDDDFYVAVRNAQNHIETLSTHYPNSRAEGVIRGLLALLEVKP